MNPTQTPTISIVGTSPAFEARATEAIVFLRSDGHPFRLQEWDGTRRSVVVASPDSLTGQAALRLTRQRGGIAIAVGRWSSPDHSQLSEQSTVAQIREALAVAAALEPPGEERSAEPGPGPDILPGGALGLISRPDHHSGEFLLRRFHIDMLVSHNRGRVIAHSDSAFGVLKSKLLDDDWTLSSDSNLIQEFNTATNLTATSLEALLVESCVGHRKRLPPYPPGRMSIEHIPDIAAINDSGDLLMMAGQLKRGIDDVSKAAAVMGIEAQKLNAMLWAMAASGLLQRDSTVELSNLNAERERPSVAPAGLIRRLAMRFGFSGAANA